MSIEDDEGVVWFSIFHDTVQHIFSLEVIRGIDPRVVIEESLEHMLENKGTLQRMSELVKRTLATSTSKIAYLLDLLLGGHLREITMYI
ncbi:hypothetical protein, partial [Acinetobacter baumannii]|uniref:hypothetical protein n=1 Tax=Acinetobacter baumannii TaxID=470 RepID=UPI00197A95D2